MVQLRRRVRVADATAASWTVKTRSVWLGFAGLLFLMGILVVDSAHQWREVAFQSTELRVESRSRDAILDELRTDVYHAATLARDYVVEQDVNSAAEQKSELYRLRDRIEKALGRYEQAAPRSEAREIQDLRVHVASLWSSLAAALQWRDAERRKYGEAFLRDTIIPRRDEVVRLVRQVSTLNERDWLAGEDHMRSIQRGFRDRVAAISVLVLVLGAMVSIVVSSHVRRLEREAVNRFNEVQQARQDMKKLSDRLVATQEEERRSLSRELHDEVGQSMSALLVELGRLQSAAPNSALYREAFATVRKTAEDSVAKIRNMALLLRPSMLDEIGLVPALGWQAREVTRRTGLTVKLIADEIDETLPDSHRTCVYRVVQEALNNCVKHSQAKEVRVVINRDEHGLLVSVQDDGVGFDPRRDRGLGLLGMAERLARVGGRFQLESHPGEGTIVSVYLPVPEERAAATVEAGPA
jgi:signal transduction histidine kinase